jgi:tRNA A-37 threonylcarbamoyl transferase component Bud32
LRRRFGCGYVRAFMQHVKDTKRAMVRIGYDGRVHKTFRGPLAKERFENEVRVLRHLEKQGCDWVPRVLEADPDTLYMVTTNCGARVERVDEPRMKEIFDELEVYGVRHEDPFVRNITYRITDGRFCVIDFEFATLLDSGEGLKPPPEYIQAVHDKPKPT